MGIFHKTLDDADKKISKDDYEGAIAILEDHIDKHLIGKERYTLEDLKKCLENYIKCVQEAIMICKEKKRGALQQLSFAEEALGKIKRRITYFESLIKEEE